ncbi:uncharacterized protein CDV56_103297 [Aspergillus thermomutatus]|uniref:Uncharacterized protein n=1 Tax=Aspergillus thermomutatus TaxID=41047 RepID=A0A397HC64_ASPTH|nr:uncharacterized protein CDV56_103297 [Aspergillus thermomutatus]RHZ60685.1 hypothetical protein CDV56_103297 [Aspergillus thermomutatus]
MEPPLNINTLFQVVGQAHRLGQQHLQKAWILFQEHSISRWIECNNVIKALPQLAAQLHDLLKPLVLAARTATRPADTGDTNESTEESDANDAEAQVIQQHAEDCLRRMLGQRASRLGVSDLDDLGLLQRDVDRTKARMTRKGRPLRKRQQEASPSEGPARRKRAKKPTTAEKSTPVEYPGTTRSLLLIYERYLGWLCTVLQAGGLLAITNAGPPLKNIPVEPIDVDEPDNDDDEEPEPAPVRRTPRKKPMVVVSPSIAPSPAALFHQRRSLSCTGY